MAMAATATTIPSSSSSSFWSKEQFVSVSQRGISISLRPRKPLSLRASSSVASPPLPSDANLDTTPRLKGIYVNNVIPALSEEFKYANVLQVFFCLFLHSFVSLILILFPVSS